MAETKHESPKLEEARKRWGQAQVVLNPNPKPAPRTPAGRGVAVSFTVGARVPRVAEQRRDVSAYRLVRSAD
jgi:hypothetical protein